MRGWLPAAAVMAAACSHGPPPDFVPDPALLDQVREIHMTVTPTACPGETFGGNYSAILNDGTTVPFETRYDKKHPPRLHVVFLERTSSDATPLQNGSWTAASDPFWTVRSGFRLSAALKEKPSITTRADVSPEYNCLPHTFVFDGSTDEDGPDVTVRLGIARSPFFERLLVASIQVGDAPPFYTIADANAIPPRDWLVIETRGGRGLRGTRGPEGMAGRPGQIGCPGGNGARGSDGGTGGPGGSGGRGGHITIIAPGEEPFLAGLVDARSPGGKGGDGGPGGKGGAGGGAGPADPGLGENCKAGQPGPSGRSGGQGTAGPRGTPGPRPQTITVPGRQVFGDNIPAALAELLDPNRRQ